MNIKKQNIVLILLCLLLSCTGCRTRTAYNYMHSPLTIVQISIVAVHRDTSKGLMIDEVITVMDDPESFLQEFKKIPCYTYWGDPQGIISEDREEVIRFEYSNGNYELISAYGIAKYTVDIGLQNYEGFQIFDTESFYALIDQYTKSSHDTNDHSGGSDASDTHDSETIAASIVYIQSNFN